MDLTERLRSLCGPNRISVRLAEGWYPSVRDNSSGNVHHDRLVLIWTRSYEAALLEAADALDLTQAKLDAIDAAIEMERRLCSASEIDHPSIIDEIHRILHPGGGE